MEQVLADLFPLASSIMDIMQFIVSVFQAKLYSKPKQNIHCMHADCVSVVSTEMYLALRHK